MNRILKNDFSWDEIANTMLRDRFNKSNINVNKSNYINKAEVVYMLNNVLGSKVLFDE
jgi:ribosomal protein L18E